MSKEYLKILEQNSIDPEHKDVLELKTMFQDHGSYLPIFLWFYAAGVPILELQRLQFKIRTYRELLRQYRITPIDVYKPKLFEAKTQYELLLDVIDNCISENQKEKFARSFISKKYEMLLSNNALNILWRLHDELKLERNQIQSLIFDKLATYQTSDNFTLHLQTCFDKLSKGDWNVEQLKIDVVDNGAEISYYDETILIAKISTYNQCKALGSRNWCISRSSYTFDMYTKKGNQYIYWNTALPRTKSDAMVGVTFYTTGGSVSFDQFDRMFDFVGKLKKYIKHLTTFEEESFEKKKEKFEESMIKRLNSSGINESQIQDFKSGTLEPNKKLTSNQINVIGSCAIILDKQRIVHNFLREKSINVNLAIFSGIPGIPGYDNLLHVAIFKENVDAVNLIFKNKNLIPWSVYSCYKNILAADKKKNTNEYKQIFKIIKDYVDQDRVGFICYILSGINWRWNEDDELDKIIVSFFKHHRLSNDDIEEIIKKVSKKYNGRALNIFKSSLSKNNILA